MEYIIAVEFLCIIVLYWKIRGQRNHINRLKRRFEAVLSMLQGGD